MKQNRPLVYLACPYSDPNSLVRASRAKMVNQAAGLLVQKGLMIFSPISHAHSIAEECDLPKGFDYWEKYDRAALSCCHRIIVLTLPGWESSVGVRAEIVIAKEMGIPIEYVTLADLRAGHIKCTRDKQTQDF